MLEFLLFSQAPVARHEQVLNILAGLTAAPPVQICEQHLVYAQLKFAESSTSKKVAANKPGPPQRLSYHKLVRDVSFQNGVLSSASPWRLRIEDVPEPGVKTVISRHVNETPITEAELEKFRGGSTYYRYINQVMLTGSRFVNGDIVVKITRAILPPEGTGALEPLDAPMPGLPEFQPLDPSGAYLIEACVRVEDSMNSKLVEQATSEILGFKKTLDGAIDLRVPDRLALDTRVKA